MWIKLRTIAAGPDFAGKPGQILDVPDPAGAAMVSGGFAEKVSKPVAPSPPLSDEEITAFRESRKEKAVAPQGKKEKAVSPEKE